MPSSPLRPCLEPHCPTLVESGRCQEHGGPRAAWHHAQPVARITGRRLQRLRTRLFYAQPLCQLCLPKGYYRAATIRDHVIPLAEGGRDDESNVQALCTGCHDAKTRLESQRGLRRAR